KGSLCPLRVFTSSEGKKVFTLWAIFNISRIAPLSSLPPMKSVALSLGALFCAGISLHATPLLTAGDPILGGRLDRSAGSFLVAAAGGDGGATIYTDNTFPAAESPDHAIDGFGQKYLNFAELDTGFIVTPSLGVAQGTVTTG